MIYKEALDKLNGAKEEEIEDKLEKLTENKNLSPKERELLLKETVGILFTAAKEYKGEELYRVIRHGNEPISSYDGLWEEENSCFGEDFLTFFADPITPFLDGKVQKDERVNLLTYRKVVSENPELLLLSGFPDDSGVFELLQKDGLSDEGKQNYQKITRFIRKAIEDNDGAFLSEIEQVLTANEPVEAFYYALSNGSEYPIMKKEYAGNFYLCTSCIFCRLDSMNPEGEEVRIEPLAHNKESMLPGEAVLYDDFGEIGCFTFEKNDYQ